MGEVFKLTECERPEVVIVEVRGLQGVSSTDVPLESNPTEIYARQKVHGESGTDTPIPPIVGDETINKQMDEFSAHVGQDIGKNAKAISEARAIVDEALTLCEDATTTANQAVETANLANVHSESAVQTATEAKQVAELSKESAKAHATSAEGFASSASASADRSETASVSAQGSAVRAEEALSKFGGLATYQKAGSVMPFSNHFTIGDGGELQINRSVFQYLQGLFDKCLKTVKQDLSGDEKQQVMQNLGAQGMLISLGRKDIVESLQGQEERQITYRFNRRAPSTDKIGIILTRRSEWSEGDVSRVTLEYDGFTTETVTIWIRNKGVSPVTVRFSVQATYEL